MTNFFTVSIGPGGMMTMGGDGGPEGNLPCEPGEEFTDYVRSKLKPFPPCSPFHAGNCLERTTLWPGRRAEFQVSGPEKQTVKVIKWTEWTTGFMCHVSFYEVEVDI